MIVKDLPWDKFPPDTILSTREAAELLGYNRRTIIAWISAGALPASRRPGTRGRYRIRWDALWQCVHGLKEGFPKPHPHM